MAPNRRQAIIWTSADRIDWRIYAALGGTWLNSLRPSNAYMHQYTNHHWFGQWLVAWSVPSHRLNQCWNIVNWTLRNKLQWNFIINSYVFIQENAFENGIWKMVAILSWIQCVNVHSQTLLSPKVLLGMALWKAKNQPKTCENWFGLVNSCVYYASQTHEINRVLPYSMDFKAPWELWNPLSKTVCNNVVLFGTKNL